MKDLKAYQGAEYAGRYKEFIEKVTLAEFAAVPNSNGEFSKAVSKAYYNLLAIKDEHEAARLHTDGRFKARS